MKVYIYVYRALQKKLFLGFVIPAVAMGQIHIIFFRGFL